MTKTVADLQTLDDEIHYQLWQSELLAEMGISRWVSQSAPVMTLSPSHWQAIEQESLERLDRATDGALVDVSSSSTAFLAPVLAPAEDAVTEESQLLDIRPSVTSDYLTNDVYEVAEPTNFEQSPTPSITNTIIERFTVQVLVYGQWVLIVDEKQLQSDPRQAQLWQQLQTQLKASIHYFRFPLLELEERDSMPTATLAIMHNRQMALAGFAGFLYRVAQTHRLQTYKMGNVSELSDCLDSQPIERLPYLSEMMTDYRLKRQLWQILSCR